MNIKLKIAFRKQKITGNYYLYLLKVVIPVQFIYGSF